MLEAMNRLCLAVGDFLFGWLLALSPSAALVAVAVGTSLVMVVVRRFTTNQDLLRRAAADKRRLKQLVREAKPRGDRDALARQRATLGQLGLVQLAAEGKPLFAALIPIAVLATWCFQRLEFLPSRANEPVELVLHTPVQTVDSLAHLVPADDVSAPRWIERIEEERDESASEAVGGVARWRVTAAASPTPYTLVVRAGTRTLEQPLLVGQATYLPNEASAESNPGWRTRIELEPFKLFGLVPGLDFRTTPILSVIPGMNQLVLAPWLVGYLLLVVPLAFLLKSLLLIY